MESFGLLLVACLFVGTSHYYGWFGAIDRLIYDTTIKRIELPADERIVIVGIDDKSLHKLGPWPWPRDLQANLLATIAAYQPERVAVDIVYAGSTEHDAALVEAASQVQNLALPVIIESLGPNQQHIEVMPFNSLLSQAHSLGHVHVELDEDAIARGTYLYQGVGTPHWPHLMQTLASDAQPSISKRCSNGTPEGLFLTKCEYVGITFAGGAGSFQQISAIDLFEQYDPSLLASALTGKTVLLGLTASGVGDWVTSPVSGTSGPLPGVEFNANLLNSILHNKLIYQISIGWAIVLGMLLVGACSLLLPRLKSKQALAATATFAGIPIVLSAMLLMNSMQIAVAATSVTVLLLYPLWSWRRHEIAWHFISGELNRIDEEERSWIKGSGNTVQAPTQTSITATLTALFDLEVAEEQDMRGVSQLKVADETRLSLAQHNLLNAANQSYFAHSPQTAILPGEILAAQISRLKSRARAVREGRDMGLAGLSRMSNGVLILSALGETRFINHAAASLLNIRPDEANDALTFLYAITPPLGQSWIDIMREVVLLKTPVYFEGRSVDQRPVYVSAEPLDDSENLGFAGFWVVTFSDLSAIRAAQAQREEALAFLSHDIRSPLLSVLALIRGYSGESPLLKDIEKYTQKGLSTSEQFLQLSRLQLQSDFERYELSLEQVIYNAIEQTFTLSREKNIEIITGAGFEEDGDSDGVWMLANGELLERAFVNLLGNAIKYSPTGAAISIELHHADGKAHLQIRDQGYGIPADELPHIFDPFFRSSEQKLAENRGAGLGLRFVKTVVERHAGKIRVTSTWQEGTTFVLELPCLDNSDPD
jgi:signal transduction histidine kinase/CHASE2 domain-containing sensor protein